MALQHIEDRTRRAIQWAKEMDPRVACLVVAGGVATNEGLRMRLERVAGEEGLRLVLPPPRLCTDNGGNRDKGETSLVEY